SSTISASTLVAQTTTNYDQFNQTSINGQTGVVATTGTTNHDYANFGSSAALRGLPTSVTRFGNISPSVTTYTDYNDLGKVTIATDGRGNSTKYTYGTDNAFLQQTTYPSTSGVPHSTTESHDINTGLLVSKTDDQNQTTTSFSYDELMRLTL